MAQTPVASSNNNLLIMDSKDDAKSPIICRKINTKRETSVSAANASSMPTPPSSQELVSEGGSPDGASTRRSGRKRVAPIREFPPPKKTSGITDGVKWKEDPAFDEIKPKKPRQDSASAQLKSANRAGLIGDSLKTAATAARVKVLDFDECFYDEFNSGQSTRENNPIATNTEKELEDIESESFRLKTSTKTFQRANNQAKTFQRVPKPSKTFERVPSAPKTFQRVANPAKTFQRITNAIKKSELATVEMEEPIGLPPPSISPKKSPNSLSFDLPISFVDNRLSKNQPPQLPLQAKKQSAKKSSELDWIQEYRDNLDKGDSSTPPPCDRSSSPDLPDLVIETIKTYCRKPPITVSESSSNPPISNLEKSNLPGRSIPPALNGPSSKASKPLTPHEPIKVVAGGDESAPDHCYSRTPEKETLGRRPPSSILRLSSSQPPISQPTPPSSQTISTSDTLAEEGSLASPTGYEDHCYSKSPFSSPTRSTTIKTFSRSNPVRKLTTATDLDALSTTQSIATDSPSDSTLSLLNQAATSLEGSTADRSLSKHGDSIAEEFPSRIAGSEVADANKDPDLCLKSATASSAPSASKFTYSRSRALVFAETQISTEEQKLDEIAGDSKKTKESEIGDEAAVLKSAPSSQEFQGSTKGSGTATSSQSSAEVFSEEATSQESLTIGSQETPSSSQESGFACDPAKNYILDDDDVESNGSDNLSPSETENGALERPKSRNVYKKSIFKASKREKAASYNPRQWHIAPKGSSSVESQSGGGFDFDEFDDDDKSDSTKSSADASAASASARSKANGKDQVVLELTRGVPSKGPIHRVVRPSIPRPFTKEVTKEPLHAFADPVTSLKVSRQHKDLFPVVRVTKEAFECQELGERQSFFDDLHYLLSGLRSGGSLSLRCSSLCSLAEKCLSPAFRMHLRAHNTLLRIFQSLCDACDDPSLALCTAAVMYIISRDRLNMDLDKSTLELMVSLLGVDSRHEGTSQSEWRSKQATPDFKRNYARVQEICKKLIDSGSTAAKHLDLDSLSTGVLAMEALLSLTAKKAGDWFKESLRASGGLDHITNTVVESVAYLINSKNQDGFLPAHLSTDCNTTTRGLLADPFVDRLTRIERSLRVLNSVTNENQENIKYLISFKESSLLSTLVATLELCYELFRRHPLTNSAKTKETVGSVVYRVTDVTFGALINLTNNEWGATKSSYQVDLIPTVLDMILHAPQHVTTAKKFDLIVLGLSLLINLVEHCDANKRLLIDARLRAPFRPLGPAVRSVVREVVEHPPGNGELVNADQSAIEGMILLYQDRLAAAERTDYDETKKPALEGGAGPSAANDEKNDDEDYDEYRDWVMEPAKKPSTDGDGPDDDDEEEGMGIDVEFVTNTAEGEEQLRKALHKAGKQLEDSCVSSYVALLLGFLIEDNYMYTERVRDHLPDRSFESMVHILKKFYNFMNLASSAESTVPKSIARVIEILEAS